MMNHAKKEVWEAFRRTATVVEVKKTGGTTFSDIFYDLLPRLIIV